MRPSKETRTPVQLLLLAGAEPDRYRDVITRWLQHESADKRADLSRTDLILMGEDLLSPDIQALRAQPLAEQTSDTPPNRTASARHWLH